MPATLSDQEVAKHLTDLGGWEKEGEAIARNFTFKDFAGALEFVNQVGAKAEAMDHHPDLFLHDWNQVKVTLSTHSAHGITNNDIELARQIQTL